MQRFAKLAAGLFGRRREPAGGLSASLEELMEQRKNLARLHQKSKLQPSDMAGEVRSAFKGRGIEMEEIREYTFGDDVRDIDWRVTARKKALIPKFMPRKRTAKSMCCSIYRRAWFRHQKRAEVGDGFQGGGPDRLDGAGKPRPIRRGDLRRTGNPHLQIAAEPGASDCGFKKIAETGRKILSAPADEGEGGGTARALQAMTKLIKSRAAVFVISDFYVFGEAEKRLWRHWPKKDRCFASTFSTCLRNWRRKTANTWWNKTAAVWCLTAARRLFVGSTKPFAAKRQCCANFAADSTAGIWKFGPTLTFSAS